MVAEGKGPIQCTDQKGSVVAGKRAMDCARSCEDTMNALLRILDRDDVIAALYRLISDGRLR
jgi:hypothetical protein